MGFAKVRLSFAPNRVNGLPQTRQTDNARLARLAPDRLAPLRFNALARLGIRQAPGHHLEQTAVTSRDAPAKCPRWVAMACPWLSLVTLQAANGVRGRWWAGWSRCLKRAGAPDRAPPRVISRKSGRRREVGGKTSLASLPCPEHKCD